MASFKLNLQEPYIKGKNDKKTLNPKHTRVYLFVIHDRNNKFKIKTEYKVKPTQWDFDKQKVKHQVPGAAPINDGLDLLLDKVEHEFNKIRVDYPGMKIPDIACNLKAFVKDSISPIYNERNKTFFQIFDQYIEAKGNDVSERTIKKFKTLKASLLEFQPDITFDRVNLTFYDKYVNHLRSQKAKGRQKTRAEGQQDGLLNDTVAKYIENLKNFMKWSYEREYHTNPIHQHSGFKAERKSKNDIVTLQLDELKKFYEHDFSANTRLEKVRDVFCFGCFTGQRWSDIEGFNKENISGDLWTFESYKTKKIINVPLVGYAAPAMDILKKYTFELPMISAQKFNEYLKEAAKEAKLERNVKLKRFIGKREILFDEPLHKLISSHTARRTAVSILLNVENMPIWKVRDITGHSNLQTLDKYINKDTQALTESMAQTKGINKTLRVMKNEAV